MTVQQGMAQTLPLPQFSPAQTTQHEALTIMTTITTDKNGADWRTGAVGVDRRSGEAVDLARIEDRAALLIAASVSNIRVQADVAAILLGEQPGTFRQLAAKAGFPQPELHAKRLKWWSQDLREYRKRAA